MTGFNLLRKLYKQRDRELVCLCVLPVVQRPGSMETLFEHSVMVFFKKYRVQSYFLKDQLGSFKLYMHGLAHKEV